MVDVNQDRSTEREHRSLLDYEDRPFNKAWSSVVWNSSSAFTLVLCFVYKWRRHSTVLMASESWEHWFLYFEEHIIAFKLF